MYESTVLADYYIEVNPYDSIKPPLVLHVSAITL